MDDTDDIAGTVLDALADAADYRRQLAASCPRGCPDYGSVCDDCAAHHAAADAYEHAADVLADDPPPAPARRLPPLRREDTVDVRDNLL